MPPSAGGKNASLQDLKERHLLTPRRKKMMEEAAIHPERCPGCDERFEVPPSNLHSNEDATWCHIPKLLPCLHTVSAAFLQSQVEEHEEANRLLLQEGCSSHDERWAELDRELIPVPLCTEHGDSGALAARMRQRDAKESRVVVFQSHVKDIFHSREGPEHILHLFFEFLPSIATVFHPTTDAFHECWKKFN